MKSVAAALVLVSVVLLAGCTGPQQPQAGDGGGGGAGTVSCEQVEGETHPVTYTQNGFSPATITVQRCDTVRWESQGSDMWVASEVHPTHSAYDGTSLNEHCPGPSFDQCGVGSSYSFTFEKTGEWGYHNHQLAGHRGTVVVQER